MGYLKQALRQLSRRPALSATIIVMLAIGVGATTAIYSLIQRTILEQVPVPNAGELVSFRSPGPKFGTARGDIAVGGSANRLFSYPMYRDLVASQHVLAGLGAHYAFLANMDDGEQKNLRQAMLVSGNYFDVLNLRPALGRLIAPEDAPVVGESRVAVLSYAYWQTRFGGDPNVIGRMLVVNNEELTVVGVAPEGFEGTSRGWESTVFVPLTLRWLMQPEEPKNAENRLAYWLNLFGRLAPGVSLEQAEAELNGIYRGFLRDVDAPLLTNVTDEQRAAFLEGAIDLEPGARGQIYTEVRPTDPLSLALYATVSVLLIACVNIANLLLARGASRAGEMAIRASIGASRGRLVGQLLAESGVLGAIGGLLSIPVAIATVRLIAAMPVSAIGLGVPLDTVLDPAVMLFATSVTLATVVLFGLLPAISTGRANSASVMKAQSAQSPGGRGLARLRGSLVGAQIALSLALLVLAGLFTRSLLNVARIDYGMQVDSLVQFSVTPLLGGYSGERLDGFFERVREELAAQPGIESVASVAFPLLYGFGGAANITVLGAEEQVENASAQTNPMVSPGFFATTSMPILRGRDFTDEDSTTDPSVVVVNESFVRKFNLGDDAVGTTLRLEGRFVPQGVVEIIGVVGDAKYSQVKDEIRPQVFAPRPRLDAQFVALFYYVRSSLDSAAVMRLIPEVVERIDPNVPVSNLRTVRDTIEANVGFDELMSNLSAMFAALASALAAIGLYAVLAFNVAQRKRELGLRLALGAQPRALRQLVLRNVAALAVVGGACGLVGALALGRVAESLLFGLTGYDPVVFGLAVGGLALIVLAASWVPARRASRVEPMEALRYE